MPPTRSPASHGPSFVSPRFSLSPRSSVHFGHYTAYTCPQAAQEGDGGVYTWHCCDDSSVYPVRSEADVVDEAAYVLFYRRRRAAQA